VLTCTKQPIDVGTDGRAERGGLGTQPVGRALGHRPVRRRHVLGQRGMLRLGGAAGMAGDPLAAVEHRHRAGRHKDVELLLHQPVRH